MTIDFTPGMRGVRHEALENHVEPLDIAVLHIRAERANNPAFQRELDELNATTLQEIRALGHRPNLVATAGLDPEQVRSVVDRSDAIVLMGGEDVDPGLYAGHRVYPGSGNHEPAADRIQITAIHHALATRTPVLGICRGLQLVNVALGGTLIQNMDNSDAHRAVAADPFVRTRLAFVSVDLMDAVDRNQANRCTHHQAIDSLGEGLRIAAVSTDEVIEAVVHEDAPLTAVQWHPEHPDTAGSQLRSLLARLAGQCVVGLEPAATGAGMAPAQMG